jgi:hypothetical protein
MKDEEELLRISIEKHILKLSYNSNGTHIIQKIISCFEEKDRKYLNDFILENLPKVCMNANGICVIKKFINANRCEEIRTMLLEKFKKECLEIVQDPFGNYAIQYAMEVYGPVKCQGIIEELVNNLLSLSMQKFSSNVVEKCIEYADFVSHNL